ncbi:S9 family peptidase [Candidatus Neomarinimicrobiota bacterium]
MRYPILVLTILLFIIVIPGIPQETNSEILDLGRIFTQEEFQEDDISDMRWSTDGSFYSRLEESKDYIGFEDIVIYNTESGVRSILVAAGDLVPGKGEDPLTIDDYDLQLDNELVIIYTNSKRVWRRDTRGDYWVLTLSTGKLKQLGKFAEPSTLMFATVSPNGQKVAYVVRNDLYVEDVEITKIQRLTIDGSETSINGTSDWVYEEEFDLRKGFHWSPNSKRIAFWHLDADSVGTFYMMNNIDSIYSQPVPIRYPKAGTINSDVKIGIISADGGKPVWAKIVGDARHDHYIPRMGWAESSEELIIQKINRKQNANEIQLVNVNSGDVQTIFTDHDQAWLDVVNDLFWLEDGQAFSWISERDGWRHVYRIPRAGGEVKLLTPGDYDVLDLLTIDEQNGWMYFIASPDNPTQRYLYRTSITNAGTMERISPVGQEGTHSYRIAPENQWAFHSFSSFMSPSQHTLINLPDHKIQRMLVDNQKVSEKVKNLQLGESEFFKLEIEDNVELDGYIIKPPDFNPKKKYPVLFFVYGEPWVQTARDRWGGNRHLWHLMLTQQGYIIINLDNRGTPAPKGRAWRKSVYRQIGILASSDQAAAAQLIGKWEFIDSKRFAIWGWSGGGSMSLNAIFRYPELYSTAMAIAFVANQRFYDTIYQERYMSLPQDNPEGYTNGSPITFAHQLQGNLLLMHGTGDDNVHYQSMDALINELINHNKMFTAIPYPNRTHSIREQDNDQRHVYETMTWYLKNNMPAGAR